ncbi:TolB family protein [Hyphobacterium sp.]|uniref:TolB family protein n=1 Tax=Hyphobacterium sp. TaxID=2004662 RepID=UPI003B5205FD
MLACLGGSAAAAQIDAAPTHLLVINNNDGERYAIHIAGETPVADCEAIWVYAGRGSRIYTVIAREDGARGYHPQICDLAVGSVTPLTGIAVYDSHAGLGPNGRVLTAARQDDDTIALVLIDPGAETMSVLDRPGALNSDPDWSPDGQYWIYRSDRDGRINLWREHIASGETIRLTDNRRPLGSRGYGGIGSGRFSPDGHWIAYSCVDDEARSQLCLMRSDGRDAQQLTDGARQTNAMYPSWHPSGERIVIGADDADAGEGRSALFEIRLADGEISRLAGQPEGSNLGAVWAGE